MSYIRQLSPKRRVRLPAAALAAVVGLAFACSESPTNATADGMAPLFKPGGGRGKPGDGGTGPATDPNPVTVSLNGVVFTPVGANPYDERDGCNVSTHLSGVNGNLAFSFQFQKNTRKLDPPCIDGVQRQVRFLIPGTPNGTVDGDFFGRIYTNSTTLNGEALPDGLRDLRKAEFVGEVATTVLGAQFGDRQQLNFGQHCPFGELDDINSDRVDVVYLTDAPARWEITAQNATAFFCTGGGQTPAEDRVLGLDVDITVIDVDPSS